MDLNKNIRDHQADLNKKTRDHQADLNKKMYRFYKYPFKIIKDSFNHLKGRWGVTILICLSASVINSLVLAIVSSMPFLAGYLLSFILGDDFVYGVKSPSIFFYFLLLTAIFLANLVMGRVFIWQNKFILDTVRGKTPKLEFDSLLDGLRNKEEIMETLFTKKGFIQFTRSGLIFAVLGIVINFGYIAIIVPGILFSIWYAFVPFLITDDVNINLSESFQRSKQQTKGHRLNIFMFQVILGSLAMISIVITFGFGFILVDPFVRIANAKFYDEHISSQ